MGCFGLAEHAADDRSEIMGGRSHNSHRLSRIRRTRYADNLPKGTAEAYHSRSALPEISGDGMD